MIGTIIAAFGLIGLYVANGQCLSTTRAHREILTAEHCLEQRTEQCRAATWTQLTTTSGVQALMNVAPVNDDSLNNHTEKITVSANPTVTPSVSPIAVTRDPSGNTAVASQPPSGFQPAKLRLRPDRLSGELDLGAGRENPFEGDLHGDG